MSAPAEPSGPAPDRPAPADAGPGLTDPGSTDAGPRAGGRLRTARPWALAGIVLAVLLVLAQLLAIATNLAPLVQGLAAPLGAHDQVAHAMLSRTPSALLLPLLALTCALLPALTSGRRRRGAMIALAAVLAAQLLPVLLTAVLAGVALIAGNGFAEAPFEILTDLLRAALILACTLVALVGLVIARPEQSAPVVAPRLPARALGVTAIIAGALLILEPVRRLLASWVLTPLVLHAESRDPMSVVTFLSSLGWIPESVATVGALLALALLRCRTARGSGARRGADLALVTITIGGVLLALARGSLSFLVSAIGLRLTTAATIVSGLGLVVTLATGVMVVIGGVLALRRR